MMDRKASISIDIDPTWVPEMDYLGRKRTSHTKEVVYDEGVYNFLDVLDKYGVKATFFTIGCDVQDSKRANTIRTISVSCHEIANHTMYHPKDFAFLSYKEKRKEVEDADKILSDVTGRKIEGFRAPGYYLDDHLIDILGEMEYSYDSSIFPTYFTMAMTLYLRAISKSTSKKKRLGKREDMFSSLKPYILKNSDSVYELPISTMPAFRIPFHFTFVLMAGKILFDIGLFMQKRTNSPLIYVFHGVDLVNNAHQRAFSNMPVSRIPFMGVPSSLFF